MLGKGKRRCGDVNRWEPGEGNQCYEVVEVVGRKRVRVRIWRCGGNGQEKREVKNMEVWR